MVFNSYSFLLFFPIVLVLTQLAPAKWRNGLLLVASYVFYASWGKRFCVLLLGLTVLVYAAGLLLGQKKRRWLFWLGLGGTLGALLVYKYLDFGLYSINALIRALGLGEPMPRVSLLQPAGISFFLPGGGVSHRCVSGQIQAGEELLAVCPVCLLLPPAPFRAHRQGGPIASPV